MNLYLVVSEVIPYIVWEDWYNNCGHNEDYRICELVVARNHGQARWLAYGTDKHGCYPSVADMPKFAVRQKRKGLTGPARVVTGDPYWHDQPVWGIGNAPHIGYVGEVPS